MNLTLRLAVGADVGREQAAGFSRFEMGATLSGVAFYTARGYCEVGLGNPEFARMLAILERY